MKSSEIFRKKSTPLGEFNYQDILEIHVKSVPPHLKQNPARFFAAEVQKYHNNSRVKSLQYCTSSG